MWPRSRTPGLDFCLLDAPIRTTDGSHPHPSYTPAFFRLPKVPGDKSWMLRVKCGLCPLAAAMPCPLWPCLVHSGHHLSILCHLLLTANIPAPLTPSPGATSQAKHHSLLSCGSGPAQETVYPSLKFCFFTLGWLSVCKIGLPVQVFTCCSSSSAGMF